MKAPRKRPEISHNWAFLIFSQGSRPTVILFGGNNFQLLRSNSLNSRPKPSFGHPPCARTHSVHTEVQLYRCARRAVLGHKMATSSLMCHVITWSGEISHISGKDMRKKDEEWLRTGTFCAAWGRMIAQTLRGYSSKRPIVTNFRSFPRGFHLHTCVCH